jgi:hypothetical protein
MSAPTNAGLDVDIAVAKAMGVWRGDPLDLRRYSTDRRASDRIVDELTALGACLHISAYHNETHVDVSADDMPLWADMVWVEGPPATALPLALCRARLHPDVVAWANKQRAARAEGGGA